MDSPALTPLRLNGRTVDLQRGSVTDEAGHAVTLRPQAAEVLKLLAVRPGKLISKDELIQAVWGGIAVTDDSLVQCITEIRKVLGDEKHEIVRTVLKRGYVLEAGTIENGGRVSGSRPVMLRRGSWTAIAAGVAILIAAVAAYVWPVRTSEAGRPSIEGGSAVSPAKRQLVRAPARLNHGPIARFTHSNLPCVADQPGPAYARLAFFDITDFSKGRSHHRAFAVWSEI